jgi:hypothetical protein
MMLLGAARPLDALGSKGIRSSGMSAAYEVSGQMVTDAVASNQSS